MCSVFGCDSERRGAPRFKLPQDPEMRLLWVQFLATVNMQRFKEASWTDITICSEHFGEDCFDHRTPAHPGVINPSAVPSLGLRSGEHETDPQSPARAVSLDDRHPLLRPTVHITPPRIEFTFKCKLFFGLLRVFLHIWLIPSGTHVIRAC